MVLASAFDEGGSRGRTSYFLEENLKLSWNFLKYHYSKKEIINISFLHIFNFCNLISYV
jgi:hypothetical protein